MMLIIDNDCKSKFDNNNSDKKVLVPSDTKYKHSCYAIPNTAKPHKNVKFLHSACCVISNLVAPKEKSFSLSAFFIKFEVSGLRMGFEILKLGHGINSLCDLHDF